MESKFKVGDKVRVKSFEEIKKTLDEDGRLKGCAITFNNKMQQHCGNGYEIDSYNSVISCYLLKECRCESGNYWGWPEEWLELVPKFKPGDLVVVKPDLIVGNTYGNDSFVSPMEETRGTVVTIKEFQEDCTKYRVEENIYFYTEEMLLTLEEAFRPGREVCRKDLKNFSNGEVMLRVGDFTKNKVWLPEIQAYIPVQDLIILPEIDWLYTSLSFAKTVDLSNDGDFDVTCVIDGIKQDEILSKWFNPINKKDYENQLQRKKTCIRRADIPEGNRVCCGKRKAAVVFGSLSNKARVGF